MIQAILRFPLFALLLTLGFVKSILSEDSLLVLAVASALLAVLTSPLIGLTVFLYAWVVFRIAAQHVGLLGQVINNHGTRRPVQ